jgi:hypothetical protein
MSLVQADCGECHGPAIRQMQDSDFRQRPEASGARFDRPV